MNESRGVLILIVMSLAACNGGPGGDDTHGEVLETELRECGGCVDDSGACVEFPADGACGTGGIACIACDDGFSCSDEYECVEDGPASSALPEQWFYLEIIDARVSASTTDGDGWDGGDNPPDPYFVIKTGDLSERFGYTHMRGEDTVEPTFDEVWAFAGSTFHHGFCPTEIASSFRVSMWDYDRDWFEGGGQKGDDFMGECEFQLTADEILSGQPVSISCARDPELDRAGFTVRLRVVDAAEGRDYEKRYDCGAAD